MDFGTLSFEGLVGTDNDESRNPTKGNGSGFLKQERSGSADQQDAWRSSKTARTDAFEAKTLLNQNHRQHQQILGSGSSPLLRSDSGISIDADQNMLSFSNSSFKNGGFVDKTPQNSLFSFHQQPPAPAYIRNAGYGPGGIHESMHVPVSRYKGLFTPSQWMELEHQALIYKHIVANVPVPSHLLTPIRKSLNPFLFSGSSSGAYAPNSFGWGTFHLGFSGNTDPEPGRCRRTDGKKWRCSRDAVPDQKYCERHINRGRHRSRKPVEGQNGQAVAGPTPNSKVGPIASSSASLISNSGTSNTLGAVQHQFKTLQHSNAVNASRETLITGAQESQAPSMVSPTVTLKSKDSSFSVPKQHTSIEGSSDSLLYPSEKSSYMYSTSCNSFLDKDAHNQNPLRHFIDEWPKDQSDRSSVAWPEELKSDWTQLSMSIPMASSDFSSATNSPRQEKLTLAPLGLCHEIEPLPSQKQGANWIPISWGSSMGGPLGEVLNSKKVSDMHHMTDVWENGSYHLGSSPTGVLQKSTFVSLSNSSTASSPRANNREAQTHDVAGGSLCDEMLLSTLASSASIRSL